MIVKIVKIYLTLSLVLWAVWGQFQGGSLCISYSVCWSRQCLISILTQRGWWWTLFFFFKAHLFCCTVRREGCCKQITLACAWRVSATLGMPPAHGTHSLGSRLPCQEPSEAGPGLQLPAWSKPLRLRHSGGPQRRRLGWACVLCPSQVRVAQVFGERGRCNF